MSWWLVLESHSGSVDAAGAPLLRLALRTRVPLDEASALRLGRDTLLYHLGISGELLRVWVEEAEGTRRLRAHLVGRSPLHRLVQGAWARVPQHTQLTLVEGDLLRVTATASCELLVRATAAEAEPPLAASAPPPVAASPVAPAPAAPPAAAPAAPHAPPAAPPELRKRKAESDPPAEAGERTCCVCLTGYDAEQGVTCDQGHFTCAFVPDSCLGLAAASERAQPSPSLRLCPSAVLPCPLACGGACAAPPFTFAHFGRSPALATAAAELMAERRTAIALAEERAAAAAAAATDAAMGEDERALAVAKRYVFDVILCDKCPKCNARYDGFDGCYALTCASCGLGFCACCHAACGTDAHAHIAICPLAQGGGTETLDCARRARRERALWDYLGRNFPSATAAPARRRLLAAVETELRDAAVNLDPGDFQEDGMRPSGGLRERHAQLMGALRAGGGAAGGGGGGGAAAMAAAMAAVAAAALYAPRRRGGRRPHWAEEAPPARPQPPPPPPPPPRAVRYAAAVWRGKAELACAADCGAGIRREQLYLSTCGNPEPVVVDGVALAVPPQPREPPRLFHAACFAAQFAEGGYEPPGFWDDVRSRPVRHKHSCEFGKLGGAAQEQLYALLKPAQARALAAATARAAEAAAEAGAEEAGAGEEGGGGGLCA